MSSGRINYLEKKYAPNRLATGEMVSTKYKSEVNRRQYRQRRYFEVKTLAHKYDFNAYTVEKTMFIINFVNDLKKLYKRAKLEQITIAILLYCKWEDNPALELDKTKPWEDYELDWKMYSRIISRILMIYRKNDRVPYNGTNLE